MNCDSPLKVAASDRLDEERFRLGNKPLPDSTIFFPHIQTYARQDADQC